MTHDPKHATANRSDIVEHRAGEQVLAMVVNSEPLGSLVGTGPQFRATTLGVGDVEKRGSALLVVDPVRVRIEVLDGVKRNADQVVRHRHLLAGRHVLVLDPQQPGHCS